MSGDGVARILVVDDVPENVRLLEAVLVPRGYDVVSTTDGSAALELALRALDVGPGHEVIIPTYACDALFHAVTRCGAAPVLADADPETLGLSAADAGRRRTARTRAAIVVHPFGRAVDLDDFKPLGVALVEDCAQMLGAILGDRTVGAQGGLAVCSSAMPAADCERVRRTCCSTTLSLSAPDARDSAPSSATRRRSRVSPAHARRTMQ